jgi:PKD repeat protein
MTRVSSLDAGYKAGDLSLFPTVLDDQEILYQPTNNAETLLVAGLSFNGKNIIVADASKFPANGTLRLTEQTENGNFELVYYGKRTNTVFTNLQRGFAGSIQNTWSSGTIVGNAVDAEHHNAIKDAVIQIETKLGLKDNPDAASLNGLLKNLEDRFLAPRPFFRAYPTKGRPALTVRFQSFSDGDVVRHLWDFGDGSTSVEINPFHTYLTEGNYQVKLTILSSTGAQGIAIKSDYITVSNDDVIPFFYVVQDDPMVPAYSQETATANSTDPALWNFVDQTDGDIVQRIWIFDDGQSITVTDANIHSITHVYQSPGEYSPTLLVVFNDQQFRLAFLQEKVMVL